MTSSSKIVSRSNSFFNRSSAFCLFLQGKNRRTEEDSGPCTTTTNIRVIILKKNYSVATSTLLPPYTPAIPSPQPTPYAYPRGID
ncbi:hypothetical protein I312_101577 [Cryptococcus bacillisporus CA1280]|uniref:uncharacterized protein n=1 Tax=Cryptococcus bacillisporus CA1280 TaxID=1296109 RepID=UPI003367F7A0